jgi:hypothetical protein
MIYSSVRFREKYQSSGIILSVKTEISFPCPPSTFAEFCSHRPLIPIQRFTPRIFRVPTQSFAHPSSPTTYPEVNSPLSPSTYAEFCTPCSLLPIQRFTPHSPHSPSIHAEFYSPTTYPEVHPPHSPSTYAELFSPTTYPEVHSPHYLRSPPPPLVIQRFTPRIFRVPTQSFAPLLPHY